MSTTPANRLSKTALEGQDQGHRGQRRMQRSSSSISPVQLLLFGTVVILVQLFLLNLIGLTRKRGFQAFSIQEQDALFEWKSPQNHHPVVNSSNFDGVFNGYHLKYHERTSDQNANQYVSNIRCAGDNYQTKYSWTQRSCHFSFMCFDTKEKEFVIFQNPVQDEDSPFLMENASLLSKPKYSESEDIIFDKNVSSQTMSLGGINWKWTKNPEGVPRLEWFPTLRTEIPKSFYTLPANVVMVPFHSLSATNPGHLLWDDFMPIYTLLSMFQLTNFMGQRDQADGNNNPMDFLLLRYVLSGDRGVWASCDWTEDKRKTCASMLKKFWPLMTSNDHSIVTTTKDAQFHVFDKADRSHPKSNLVCARQGVAGLGSLTDHGTRKAHGWEENDYRITHNHGRAGLFWDFRTYAMKNIGLVEDRQLPLSAPYKIVFSTFSSERHSSSGGYKKQIRTLKKAFDNTSQVSVESYTFKELSVRKQVQVASQASIFLTQCGGGAMTSMFVPKGSSIFVFYNTHGGVENNQHTFKPARLDWDFFNNLGYARVHWIPQDSMSTQIDADALVELVRHELSIIKREREMNMRAANHSVATTRL